MNEGNTVIVTLTRGSSATNPIKGTVRTEAYFAQADDFDHGSTTVYPNGNSTGVEIDTTQDTRIEGDESFRVKRFNDHNNAVSSCLVLILDDEDAYRFGEQIVFELTLDAKLKVHGQPGLKITVGESVSGDRSSNADAGTQVGQADRTRWAVYDADLTWDANGSSEGPTVIFVYEVGPTDKASGGVAVPENDDDRTQFVIPGSAALLDDDGNAIEDRFEVKHKVTSSPHVTYQAHYDHDGLAADSDHAVDGTDPLIEIDFGSVNSALGATLTFWKIPNDDGDLTWRADVTSDGDDKDSCEGTNMGAVQTIDEDDIPDLGESIERAVNPAGGCTAGTYNLEVTATVDGEEVASASTSFQINLSWSPSEQTTARSAFDADLSRRVAANRVSVQASILRCVAAREDRRLVPGGPMLISRPVPFVLAEELGGVGGVRRIMDLHRSPRGRGNLRTNTLRHGG